MCFMYNILRLTKLGSLTGAAVIAGAATVSAATLTGNFSVEAVNVTDVNSAESEATLVNFNTTFGAAALGDKDSFTYDGALNFGTSNMDDSTTIGDWLATGGGTLTDLDSTFADLTLSTPNINNGTATTTFFSFVLNIPDPVTEFAVRHDDGMTILDDGTSIGGFQDPTSERNTSVFGFDGGEFRLIYVATNGDPSILEVSAVPLPAGGLLLLTALGGVAALRRKRKAA